MLAICIVAICLAQIEIEVVSNGKYGMKIKEFNIENCLKIWYEMFLKGSEINCWNNLIKYCFVFIFYPLFW